MGRGAVVPGALVRTGAGCPVPARLASGPANQPIGVVAAVGLTQRHSARQVRGSVAGATTAGAG